jgi:hypothetical protein
MSVPIVAVLEGDSQAPRRVGVQRNPFMRYSRLVVFCAALAATSAVLPAQTTYRYIDVESILPGASAGALNNLGHVVMRANNQVYLYANGVATPVPEIGGLTNYSIIDMNDRDVLLGSGLASDGTRKYFTYDVPNAQLQIREFNINEGYEYPLTLNNLGQIAVGSTTGTWYIDRIYDGDTVVERRGHGLNDDGFLLLDDWSMWNIRTGVTAAGTNSFVAGVVFGDNGWMAGSSPTTLIRTHLEPGKAPVTDTIGQWSSRLYASDINGSGVVVGSLWDRTSTPWHGFVSFGGVFDLNNLTTPPDGFFIQTGSQINDLGQIVGSATTDIRGGLRRSFILEPLGILPVPEPATYYAGAGLLLLLATAWRRRSSRAAQTKSVG